MVMATAEGEALEAVLDLIPLCRVSKIAPQKASEETELEGPLLRAHP